MVAGGAEGAVAPLDRVRFTKLIEALGPFELRPIIAVAVSGGADSLCLVTMVDAWARAQAGCAVALTVDHGLRPDAVAEAAQVARWMAAAGIRHHILQGTPTGGGGVQAAARRLRYELLTGWCRTAGVLHLALAHHRNDQAETVLLRLDRGSGADGLAGMPALSYRDGVRLLRPLLTTRRTALRASMTVAGRDWIDDPSNHDPAYDRTKVRAALAALPGADDAAIASAATAAGGTRRRGETVTAETLARSVGIHPAGFCWLDPACLGDAPEDIGDVVLARLIRTIGGATYAPRRRSVAGLRRQIQAGALGGGRTLGGCLIRPRRDGSILVCREPTAVAGPIEISGSDWVRWDRRFDLRLDHRKANATRYTVRKLGAGGWRAVRVDRPELAETRLPASVRPSLPALFDLDGILEVPHLLYRREVSQSPGWPQLQVRFRPTHALAGPRFQVMPSTAD